jgi:predicted O-linked N-acetylglucosamine transferase (SPINDLY family)
MKPCHGIGIEPSNHRQLSSMMDSKVGPAVTDNHTSSAMEQGAALLNQGRPEQALEYFRCALVNHPEDALTCYNSGLAYHTLKDYARATAYYRKALNYWPGWVDAHHNLGQAYEAQSRFQSAMVTYEKALALDPTYFKSAFRLSLLYRRLGKTAKAVRAIQKAVRAKPDSAEALCTLGMMYREQNRFDEALVCLEQALCIDPELAPAYYNKGIVLQKAGAFEAGIEQYGQAMTCDPGFAPARWLHQLSLPMIYDVPEEIDHHRHRFQGNLDRLIASTPLETVDQKAYALSGVRTTTNFHLQYQCRNDLALQQKYGNFVHNVMKTNFPHWASPREMPLWKPPEKIRIGYVSTFMYDHTVGTFLSGWLENHTQKDFEIHTYYVGQKVDHATRHISDLSAHFRYFAGNMEAAARQIDSDNLHLLVYCDIGMAPITLQLAALRLAPIQCKGWGHPVTTGLPTIDYYLSSDLMEPDNADGDYSESLVRLPNLALCYGPPKLPETPKTRQALKIPDHRFVYLSTQSLFKYLPQHDDIYPRIAKAVPRACFVFISNESKSATTRFRSRLKRAFGRYGLEADRFCCFSKRVKFEDFLSLNMAADVLLDSLEWSGGKTTLEALSCGLPVVTLPGRFMRGRHAYAMLRMMGLDDTIADDKEAYCDIAVRLAKDPLFLRQIKAFIFRNRSKLYHDQSVIKSLESFYRSVIFQYGSAHQQDNPTLPMSNC